MYLLHLTIVMIIINVVHMFVAGINVKMFNAALTLFFQIQFVKKTRNNILLICVYVLITPRPFIDNLYFKKSKDTLRTKSKVKIKIKRSTL